jgi:predicted TIM-barrel fold metal-dependent hydrolase
MAAVDYWCNAFTPDRRPLWDAAIDAQGIPLTLRRDEGDSFAEAAELVARMDELELGTLLLPAGDLAPAAGPLDYERFSTRVEDVEKLAADHAGRFAGLFSIDPTQGLAGVRRAAEVLGSSAFVGLVLHTHSFDRRFDDRDLYPFYSLASEHGVPVVVQAGASGGRMASECGRPIGIDRPALYFPEVPFVLSHTGWPWVEEAIAMALKFSNVFLGTAAYPPHHWSESLRSFIRGPGRGKVMLGTSFPTVGHRHALERLDALELSSEARGQLLNGAAMRVFGRLANDDR